MQHTQKTITDQEWSKLLEKAETLGRAAGIDAGANWTNSRPSLKGQNVSKSIGKEAAKILAMCDEGDPALDHFWQRAPKLSGEYADDPTPARLYAWLGVDADADTDDMELCQVYENAAAGAMDDVTITVLR